MRKLTGSEEAAVEGRYPLIPKQEAGDQANWPWVSGVVQQCGLDEWVSVNQLSDDTILLAA